MELLAMLEAKGIKVTPEGDRLKVEPADKLTPELVELIRKNKPKILNALKPQQKPFRNLSLTGLIKAIDDGIPSNSYLVVDFEGTKAVVCRKDDEQKLQEQGLITFTPDELARLYLANTSKETFHRLLKIKKEFAGHIVNCIRYDA